MPFPIAPLCAQRTDTSDLLPAVFIPIIDYGPQDGLNHYDLFDNNKPVILTIVMGSKYKKDSVINLYWDGNLIATRILNEDDVKSTTIGMSVLPIAISAPLGIVYYTTFHPLTDELEISERREVLVNTLIPGNPDPDNTTPTINENLTKPEGIPEVIDADAAANGIEVTVAPWLNMEAGDVLTLYWGGTQQRVQNLPLPEDQLGEPQLIFADKDTIAAAGDRDNLIVNYDIRDSVNNWSLKSLPALTNVDIGANTLAAPRVLDALDGVIDLATLGTADVRVQLPAYTDIAENDEVTLDWQGETPEGVPVAFKAKKTLSDSDVDFPPVMEVPNSFAMAIAGGRATVAYEVDTAGNVRHSRKVSVDIKGEAAQLLPPAIEGVTGDQLDVSQIPAQGATVIVPAYMGMDFGDQVLLTWRGKTQQGQDLVHTDYTSIAREEIGQPVTFTVPKSNATALENSLLMLSYRVLFYATGPKDSPVAEFNVSTSGSINLPAPTVDYAPGNIFDPDAHDGTNVHMSIGLLREDEATLFWGVPGQPGALSKEFRIATDNQPVQWAITAEQIETNRNQVVSVYYQVQRAGRQLDSLVLPLSIKAESSSPLSIENSDMTLNGRILRYDAVPLSPPANSHQTRAATGGMPPYRYSASDPTRVDVQPETGHVIAHRNGNTRITVTDSAGATAGYNVNVSNALRMHGTNDIQAYNIAVKKAELNGGHVPSMGEYNEFRATYDGQPKTAYGHLETWSTDKGGLSKKSTIILNTGTVGSESTLTGWLAWSMVAPAN